MSVSVAVSSLYGLQKTSSLRRTLARLGCTIFFPTLSHKRHDFQKNVIGHKMCVLISLQLLSETFLIVRRTDHS
jgi:hypothetical protein